MSSGTYRICLKLVNGVWFAAHEGTYGFEQWLYDFDCRMDDIPGIGRVSQGFNVGLRPASMKVLSIIEGLPWIACGHSRGAAQATITAIYAANGARPPLYRIVFGEPPSCDGQAAKLIANVPARSFYNDGDPVVEVPPHIPVALPYVRVTPLIKLRFPPSANNPWLDYPERAYLHYMPDYERNVKTLYAGKAP